MFAYLLFFGSDLFETRGRGISSSVEYFSQIPSVILESVRNLHNNWHPTFLTTKVHSLTIMQCNYICEGCNRVMYSIDEAEAHITFCIEEMSERTDDNNNPVSDSSPESSQTQDCVEILTSEVLARPPLWNNSLPYQERGFKITEVLWSEIDRILDKQPGTCQNKFKNLRDRFIKLLAKSRKYKKSGSGATTEAKKSAWKYYDQLKFLIPAIEYRSTTTSLKKPQSLTSDPVQSDQSDMSLAVQAGTSSASRTVIEQRNGQRNGGPKRKGSTASTATENNMDPFRNYCQAQLEATNNPPDRISAFCTYLESELRAMNEEEWKKMTRDIMQLLLNAKEDQPGSRYYGM